MSRQIIKWSLMLVLPIVISTGAAALAALNLPAGFATHAGSDGAFAPETDVTVDLSLAHTGAWDSAGSGNGVYDPDQWVVVFKYSSVSIPEGLTVTFSNHPSRAPVVWLVDGDADIDGLVALNGQDNNALNAAGEPGPGGFRGGYRYQSASLYNSAGFGPGGPLSRQTDPTRRDGSYATMGYNGGQVYGNVRVMPLIGGSGGSGGSWESYLTGGGGGGAILIVVHGALTLNGGIQATGGHGYYKVYNGWTSGHGSGGAVRLVADTFGGEGWVNVDALDANAARGRIRLEANNVAGTVGFYPQTDVIAPDDPVLIWPPAAAPSVKVVSIGQTTVQADPRASLEVGQSDVVIDHTETAIIELETRNVDTANGSVQVRVLPRSGDAFLADAIFDSGTEQLATWIVETTLPEGFFTVQAIARNPEQ